ncbi:MAG: D-2-hydroxyacid dehydrogenase [Clostridiaceae bacterium]
MKIIVDTANFKEFPLLKLKEDFSDVEFVFEKNPDKIKEEIEDADAIICMKLSNEALDKAKKLKWIQATTAGVDFWPIEKLNDKGIILTTARGVHKSHISEYAISMMIMSSRNIHNFILQKKSKKMMWLGKGQDEISGKKLGIIGLGSIGKELAKKADFLGMDVYGVKRTVEKVDYVKKVFDQDNMDWIFENCDYIINLLPYTKDTFSLINKKYFDMVKPTSTMINIGRGKTVNEEDLYIALKNKQMKLYISDVFVEEPLPETSPLWDLDNIIITPHIAGPNANYSKKLYEVIKPNIESFINSNELNNKYDLKKGY